MPDCDLTDCMITCIDCCCRACRLCEGCEPCCRNSCSKMICAGIVFTFLIASASIMLASGIDLSNTASVPLADAKCDELCGVEYSILDTQTCCLTSSPSTCK